MGKMPMLRTYCSRLKARVQLRRLPAVPESALYPLRPAPAPGAAPDVGQAGEEPVLPMRTYLQRQELAHLNRAIQQCGGNKEQAALLLGISIATMYRRLGGEDKEA